jgi:NhaP-type Na+/H+ and K+/H+ antiporter
MFAAISLIVILFLSILINRIATTALSHTGLSEDSARFQARSAFTGSGFTTAESEKVLNHPVRRKIAFWLMLIGNVGFVTVVSSLILSFTNARGHFSIEASVIIIAVGILLLWWVTKSRLLDRLFSKVIDWALKRFTDVEVRDYVAIMHLSGDYQITEFHVDKDDWLSNKVLKELELPQEGIMVLGIMRKDGDYIGAPGGDTKISPEDLLTIYGKASAFKELDERRKGRRGDQQHQKAVRQHEKDVEEEHLKDEEAS